MRDGTKKPGQEPRRHPESVAYRCFLSDLTRFTKFRRAGPTQAGKSIPQVDARVKDASQLVGNGESIRYGEK